MQNASKINRKWDSFHAILGHSLPFLKKSYSHSRPNRLRNLAHSHMFNHNRFLNITSKKHCSIHHLMVCLCIAHYSYHTTDHNRLHLSSTFSAIHSIAFLQIYNISTNTSISSKWNKDSIFFKLLDFINIVYFHYLFRLSDILFSFQLVLRRTNCHKYFEIFHSFCDHR